MGYTYEETFSALPLTFIRTGEVASEHDTQPQCSMISEARVYTQTRAAAGLKF